MIKEEFSGEITEDLKKCFSNIVDQYETNKNYSKTLSQIKELRSIICSKQIKNSFSIEVYEYSSLLSIDNYDIENFNISLSKLICDLYPLYPSSQNKLRFFRLYFLYVALTDTKEISILLQSTDYHQNKDYLVDIKGIITSLIGKDFIGILKQFSVLSDYYEKKLIVPFLPRIKILSLITFAQAFYTEMDINFIYKYLSKWRDESFDDFIKFLKDNKVIIDEKKQKIKCKESLNNLKENLYLCKIFSSSFK